MSGDYDLIIRNGTIVDGTGSENYSGDVAIENGAIAAVGKVSGRGREEIDAKGHVVTPGFVDIHTHYDGQVIWDTRTEPSASHGVTTVVMGNCGVGFAPCRPRDRERLIRLMEGVEDIPEAVMTDGLPWQWETFGEYLDVVARRQRDINVAAQLPHACLRVYVMGERATNFEAATPEDLAQITLLTEYAMRAGAVGFGTSRVAHRDSKGGLIPTKDAAEAELHAVAAGMRAAGHGVIEANLDMGDIERDFDMLCRLSTRWSVPLSFSLFQNVQHPDVWKNVLALLARAQEEGHKIKAQVIGRPTGLHMGLDLSDHPFTFHPTYQSLAALPLEDKVAAMRQPDVRARILSETPENKPMLFLVQLFQWTFALGNPPNYEPPLNTSVAAIAARRGVRPEEIVYDMLLEDEGEAILFTTVANYQDGNLGTAFAMLKDKNTILGLADGGAHYGIICDAGYPTFMLSYWARDRRGEKLSLEETVRKLTCDTAQAVGLNDRGRIAPGYRADLNVIDHGRLKLHMPRVHFDLPAGGRRLMQAASGYAATIVNGVVTRRDDQYTGALPGRLVKPTRAA